eukprot:4110468-Prymnesium_polylepis.1
MAERAPHGVHEGRGWSRTGPLRRVGVARRAQGCMHCMMHCCCCCVGLLYNCLLWVGRVPYV